MRPVFVEARSGVGIAAAPKVGTLSIIRFLFELREGRPPGEGEATHDACHALGFAKAASWAFARGIPVIAVHRDPWERMSSAYQSRVFERNEAPDHGFPEFCRRLCYYRGYPSIAWHTDSQTAWLGPDPAPYAATLPLSRLDELPALVRGILGRPVPAMGRAHQSSAKPACNDELRALLEPWARPDLDAGWDGRLARLPTAAA